jgi:hypothetical protein
MINGYRPFSSWVGSGSRAVFAISGLETIISGVASIAKTTPTPSDRCSLRWTKILAVSRCGLGLRDWEKAQQKIWEWEADGRIAESEAEKAPTLEVVCAAFIADAKSRELQESTLRKYKQLTCQMQAFAAGAACDISLSGKTPNWCADSANRGEIKGTPS